MGTSSTRAQEHSTTAAPNSSRIPLSAGDTGIFPFGLCKVGVKGYVITTPLDFWPIRRGFRRPARSSFLPLHLLGSQWLKSWIRFSEGVTHIANGTGNEDLDLEVSDIEDSVDEMSSADSAGGYRSWRSFRCVGPFCRVMKMLLGRLEISSKFSAISVERISQINSNYTIKQRTDYSSLGPEKRVMTFAAIYFDR
jgi:hypothetical protein